MRAHSLQGEPKTSRRWLVAVISIKLISRLSATTLVGIYVLVAGDSTLLTCQTLQVSEQELCRRTADSRFRTEVQDSC